MRVTPIVSHAYTSSASPSPRAAEEKGENDEVTLTVDQKTIGRGLLIGACGLAGGVALTAASALTNTASFTAPIMGMAAGLFGGAAAGIASAGAIEKAYDLETRSLENPVGWLGLFTGVASGGLLGWNAMNFVDGGSSLPLIGMALAGTAVGVGVGLIVDRSLRS